MKIPAVGGNVDINDNLFSISKTIWNDCFKNDLEDKKKSKVTLLKYAEIISGGTPSKKNQEYYKGGTIPWITPKDLSKSDGRFVSKGLLNITDIGLKESSAQIIPKDSILFSSRAPIGYIAINRNEITTNQGFKSLVPLDNNYMEFLYFLMIFLKPTIVNTAGGSTFKEISGTGMKSITFSKIDPVMIKKFHNISQPLFEGINNLENENEFLEEVKIKILNKLF